MAKQARSIRRRVTVAIAALTAVVHAVGAVVIYLAATLEADRSASQELAEKAALVRHHIGEAQRSGDTLELQYHLDDAVAGHGRLRLWLTDARDDVLYGDPGTYDVLLTSLNKWGEPQRDETGTNVRVQSQLVSVSVGSWQIERITFALDVAEERRFLQRLLLILVLTAVAGTIGMTTMGAIAVTRALAPLRRLSQQADTLGTASLATRLSSDHADQEVEPLVDSLNAALARIESSYRRQEAFSADVAHELGTPLAVLRIAQEAALEKLRSQPSSAQQSLESGLEEVDRMSTILRDMLFLARADQGDVASRETVSSMAAVAREVAEYYEPVAEESNKLIRVVGDASAQADQGLMKRALSNLLSNAIAHGSAGDTVEILVSAQPESGSVQVVVENAAPPMGDSELDRLFDRFYRGDPARANLAPSAVGRHHGLGLSIVAAIVRMHGGRTLAYSRDGRVGIGFELSASCPT